MESGRPSAREHTVRVSPSISNTKCSICGGRVAYSWMTLKAGGRAFSSSSYFCQLVGFDYITRPQAPSDYQQLQRAVTCSLRTGQPLPVSSAHSETVLYRPPTVNFALRFWHDVAHVLRGWLAAKAKPGRPPAMAIPSDRPVSPGANPIGHPER